MSIKRIFGTGDRVKFMVNPKDGKFEIRVNNELINSGEFNITEPVTFSFSLFFCIKKLKYYHNYFIRFILRF